MCRERPGTACPATWCCGAQAWLCRIACARRPAGAARGLNASLTARNVINPPPPWLWSPSATFRLPGPARHEPCVPMKCTLAVPGRSPRSSKPRSTMASVSELRSKLLAQASGLDARLTRTSSSSSRQAGSSSPAPTPSPPPPQPSQQHPVVSQRQHRQQATPGQAANRRNWTPVKMQLSATAEPPSSSVGRQRGWSPSPASTTAESDPARPSGRNDNVERAHGCVSEPTIPQSPGGLGNRLAMFGDGGRSPQHSTPSHSPKTPDASAASGGVQLLGASLTVRRASGFGLQGAARRETLLSPCSRRH